MARFADLVEVPIAGPSGTPQSLRLSVVIPAYNEERRLGPTLEHLTTYLSNQDYGWEIVVVSNGSSDNTAGVVQRAAQASSSIRLIVIPDRGKGIACRTGALQSAGDIVFLCDADLSMPPETLADFFCRLENADVVVGSREAEGATRYSEPWHRHAMGRVFNRLVKAIAVDGIEDTQCGFKAFRREAARDLFGQQRLNGFAFDVELLYLARKYGYRIQELGIHWYFDDDTRVRPGIDTLGMVKELAMIRISDFFGRYRPGLMTASAERSDLSG